MDPLYRGELMLLPLVYWSPLLTGVNGFAASSTCYRSYYDRYMPAFTEDEHSVNTCYCGIHGYVSIEDAAEHVQRCKRLAVHAAGETPLRWPILAAIAQWGQLDQYTNVVRSERAKVIALFDPRAISGTYDPIRMACPDPTGWLWGDTETELLGRAANSAGLPVLRFEREHWLDPAWVRAWAHKRNLILQDDMVQADKLLEDLQAS